MRKQFKWDQRRFQVDVTQRAPLRGEITEDEMVRPFDLGSLTQASGRMWIEGRLENYFVKAVSGGVWVTVAGESFFFEKTKAGSGAEDAHDGFAAPMPGKVIQVSVSDGSEVEAGQVLVVMEAMKMEHRIEAPSAGKVVKVHFGEGDLVDQGVHLLDFEPNA